MLIQTYTSYFRINNFNLEIGILCSGAKNLPFGAICISFLLNYWRRSSFLLTAKKITWVLLSRWKLRNPTGLILVSFLYISSEELSSIWKDGWMTWHHMIVGFSIFPGYGFIPYISSQSWSIICVRIKNAMIPQMGICRI